MTESKIPSDALNSGRSSLIAFISSYVFTVRHSVINLVAFSRRSFTFCTTTEELMTEMSFFLYERNSFVQLLKLYAIVTRVATD